MTPEINLLVLTAASAAFVHTILGPDHYLPFVAMAKARGWTIAKTLQITLWCGLGHLVGSVALGAGGIAFGAGLAKLEWIESVRGDLAAWMLIGFGLAYMAWGLRRAWRNRPHSHWHAHDGTYHCHEHNHHDEHAHVHDAQNRSVASWFSFVIFVLGPCEPLIPLLMYPAATESVTGVIAVTATFGMVTVMTMLLAVLVATVITLATLSRNNEFTAMKACGIGVTGLTLPIIGFSALLAVSLVVGNEFVTPVTFFSPG